MTLFVGLRRMLGASMRALAATAFLCAVAPAVSAQEAVDFSKFDGWKKEFRTRALTSGIPAAVFEAAFKGISADKKVIEFDRNQAEFNRAIWEYLAAAVSDRRVSNGRAAALANADTLAAIEIKYGVPKEVVVAIWGVESAFGRNRGGFDVVRSMATLAFEGRRKARFEAELLAALRILAAGDIEPRKMLGSWAGAMGHTQFMPSSYLELAVDFDGDGKRNIWSDNPVDALASTARYLSVRGWKTGEPWGVEIALPKGFDFRLLDGGPRSTSFWTERGLKLKSGEALPAGLEAAEILLPAGANGPAFLVFNNYRVILSYNPATAYALAVLLLSERIGGKPKHTFAWPVDDRPLTRTTGKELQEKLTGLGFDTGGIDGIVGANTRAAIRRFQTANGLIADGYASEKLLDYVRRAVAAREGKVFGRPPEPPSEADIREMQTLLKGLGYRIGTIDGKAGRLTTAALSSVIKKRGLDLKPEPSKAVLEELRKAARGE
ncbi:MAG: lytic murein transglycosylase [Neomegalonema sp.]|nr:lytic murein transglycosylase [Neomegalonema sp.]